MVKIAETHPYKVRLRGMGNPDRGQYVDVAPTFFVSCDDVGECRQAVAEFIKLHDLGAGNWGPQCGEVFIDGEYAGRFSYNLRFWDRGTEYGKPLEEMDVN